MLKKTNLDCTVDVMNKCGTNELTVTPAVAEGIWGAHANIFLKNQIRLTGTHHGWLHI